jgi:hypothetical protein
MPLDVYFQQDLAQSIVAMAVGMLSSAAAHGGTNVEYCRGVIDFARSASILYRIPWSRLCDELIANLSQCESEQLLETIAARNIVMMPSQRSDL